MKGHIPKAGPKYRLGMYFHTIHDLPSFDDVIHDGGYTSYYETDTEVDSDLGNFIFNNVGGDSASLICIEEAIDTLALRKRQEETKQQHHHQHQHYRLEQDHAPNTNTTPTYRLEHGHSPTTMPNSPVERHHIERKPSLSRSTSSSSSQHYRKLRYSESNRDTSDVSPPPVPPPRRSSSTPSATAEFQDHTYETLDDCKDDYFDHHHHHHHNHHHHEVYVSKGSDDSHDSTARPVHDDVDSNHSGSSGKQHTAEGAAVKYKEGKTTRGSSFSVIQDLSEAVNYRQRRKMTDPTPLQRKRRSEKVASKNSHPPPMKGFPAGVPDGYMEYPLPMSPDRRSPMTTCVVPSPPIIATPSARGQIASPERRQQQPPEQQQQQQKSSQPIKKPAPLVIKHKGKTFLVPVLDQKLQKELDRRTKMENPSVSLKQGPWSSALARSSANSNGRSYASPPKMEPSDQAAPHKKRSSNNVSSSAAKPPAASQKPSKQVTHYGVF